MISAQLLGTAPQFDPGDTLVGVAVIAVCVGVFVVVPICACLLGCAGKIDLTRLLGGRVIKQCARCGNAHVGRFCSRCGLDS